MRWVGFGVVVALATVMTACSGSSTVATSTPVTPAPSAGPAETTASAEPSLPATQAAAADPCGQAFLARLTPRQKLGQLLTVGVTGTADAVSVVRDSQVGGIFIGGWTDQSLLTAGGVGQVQGAANIPVMVTIDEEGGRVSRVANLIGSAPAARELPDAMSPQQVREFTAERARKMKELGITVDFAPDVDVSSQPDDSVIGDRSYSDDPNVVTQYGDAVIQGLHDGGLGAVIKHFPGHGSGSGDSHTGAVSTPPLDQLQTTDLVPFRNLVGSGAGVMVGHLDVPGLTAPGVPASISPAAMNLLRTGADYNAPPFDGVIFTDDLGGMAAITSRMSIPDAVEAALEAGADNALWITTDEVPAVLDRLDGAVTQGRLPEARVDQSVLRVARYKGALTC
ncbi:glycoside hydrolase family 3 protein [Aldersonia sp. NBC_00410]|uniref:glycoside hydrolase family 3 N-terminal domain-containing protein n=1 Tax=Aldersonia sp. NBC_00410 TaxID=2975954 RepID=UPI0022571F4F|nr:glycoside hydrolase family 3 N-terminal domain-containing protein [Aldersonia sp. NBC_00410]MCX5043053.1 glycoside hydrolase family 3 protein [Aldersonia sp. NBC_00410]